MYAIYFNNRRFGKKLFTSYEAARSHARKYARKGFFGGAHFFDWSDFLYHNPALSQYNVTIKAIS